MPQKIMSTIISKAPVRICDIGGWTDCWFDGGHGATLNFASWPGVEVKLQPVEGRTTIDLPDFGGKRVEIADRHHIRYDGTHDLLKAAVKRMNLTRNAAIEIGSKIPPACGVGTSAAVSVALLGALNEFNHNHLDNYQIARLAHKLEIEELHLECGVQDQYGSALGGAFGGGMIIIKKYPDEIEFRKLPRVDHAFIKELSDRMLLLYTGPRSSTTFHLKVIDNIKRKHRPTLRALETLRAQPERMYRALTKQDFPELAAVIDTNWQAQKELHPEISPPLFQKIEKVARQNQAMAVKANGAGGGGSMVVLTRENQKKSLAKKFAQMPEVKIIETNLTDEGLKVEERITRLKKLPRFKEFSYEMP